MRRWKLFGFFLVIALLGGGGYWLYQRPLPAVQAEVVIPQNPASEAVDLPWPAYGQAAIGAVDHGGLEKNGPITPVPIASIAKAITALAILEAKPLQSGQQGPLITITEADVQLFNEYFAKDGSVLPVSVGQQISQYQALQAMLLPSANNIADTAVRWAFGSVNEYTKYANRFVKKLGLKQTKVADASGFSPQTVSTAEDLIMLGDAVLKNPVLAEIVNQSAANFPQVGTINSVNWLLGTDGIVGIKTGNTDEAGGCYLFGAKRTVAGETVTLIGVILGAPTRNIAMSDSRTLIQAADSGFELAEAVKDSQVVARYKLPWGGSVDAVTTDEIEVLNWKSEVLATDTDLDSLTAPAAKNKVIGEVKAGNGDSAETAKVVLKQAAAGPSWTWRIFR